MLNNDYHFDKIPPPDSISDYLASHKLRQKFLPFQAEIIRNLVSEFEPFDARPVDETSILAEPVDTLLGLPKDVIDTTIAKVLKHYQLNTTSPLLEYSLLQNAREIIKHNYNKQETEKNQNHPNDNHHVNDFYNR